jgi:alpha-beta hydrolase superfamily lysophospholipase
LAGGLVRRDVPAAYATGERAPVVLIPGVLEEWTMMRAIADALSAAGHPVHTLPELRRNTATVADAAALVAIYLAARDLSDVVLVAHSKGGLIAKSVLLGEEARRVRRVVTVATPFGGSVLARLVPHPVVRSLAPDDATIVELAGRDEVNHLVTSICPAFDPHIPGGSRLEGATNIPVAAMGHFRVLADREVIDAVVAAGA